ncbi:MAG: hypothetical protein ACRDOF_01065, partial [Gaiellaceae bacterium]
AALVTVPAVWQTITSEAAIESPLWAEALLLESEQVREPVFSALAPAGHAVGLETIYEGYLVHYGRSRLFSPPDCDCALLLGDYLYAHGLVRVAATGDVAAVADLAELISLCSQARGEGRDGDGAAWAATAASLGVGDLSSARDALRLRNDASLLEASARSAAGDGPVDRALAAHARLVG